MDTKKIGKEIRKIRSKLNITQLVLSKDSGILQTVLSKIENGQISFSEAYILNLLNICRALDIKLDDVLDGVYEERKREENLEIQAFIDFSQTVSETFEFDSIKDFLKSKKESLFLDNPVIKRVILRLEAAHVAFVQNDITLAIRMLETTTFERCKRKDVLYQDLMNHNTLAGMYSMNGDLLKAKKLYENVYLSFSKNHFSKKDRFYFRVLYNLCRIHTALGEHSEALSYANLGIRLNKINLTMYGIADFLYTKCLILNREKNLHGCEKALKQAQFFSKFLCLQNNIEYETTMELVVGINKQGVWEYEGKSLSATSNQFIHEMYSKLEFKDRRRPGRPSKK